MTNKLSSIERHYIERNQKTNKWKHTPYSWVGDSTS